MQEPNHTHDPQSIHHSRTNRDCPTSSSQFVKDEVPRSDDTLRPLPDSHGISHSQASDHPYRNGDSDAHVREAALPFKPLVKTELVDDASGQVVMAAPPDSSRSNSEHSSSSSASSVPHEIKPETIIEPQYPYTAFSQLSHSESEPLMDYTRVNQHDMIADGAAQKRNNPSSGLAQFSDRRSNYSAASSPNVRGDPNIDRHHDSWNSGRGSASSQNHAENSGYPRPSLGVRRSSSISKRTPKPGEKKSRHPSHRGNQRRRSENSAELLEDRYQDAVSIGSNVAPLDHTSVMRTATMDSPADYWSFAPYNAYEKQADLPPFYSVPPQSSPLGAALARDIPAEYQRGVPLASSAGVMYNHGKYPQEYPVEHPSNKRIFPMQPWPSGTEQIAYSLNLLRPTHPLPYPSQFSNPLEHHQGYVHYATLPKVVVGQPIPQSMMDDAPLAPDPNNQDQAVLEIQGNLYDMTRDWTMEESKYGRRLVKFEREQRGLVIYLRFEPIKLRDYREDMCVVSCIWRRETQEYFVTSVNCIALLELIVNQKFRVEEKNRIRRNLEVCKPLTVSKSKRDQESFFRQIMSFPEPKPRNIEKDLKVFLWCNLENALKKIVSKYSAN